VNLIEYSLMRDTSRKVIGRHTHVSVEILKPKGAKI